MRIKILENLEWGEDTNQLSSRTHSCYVTGDLFAAGNAAKVAP